MIWLLAVMVVVVAVVALVATRTTNESNPASDVRQVLDRRLAAGELTTAEHAHRASVLAEGARPVPSQRAAVTAVIAAVALVGVLLVGLLAAGVAWDGPGWGWAGHDRSMFQGMGDHMGWTSDDGSASEPVAGAATVEVSATDMRFAPTSIEATAGEPINITLANDGQVFHDLTIPDVGFQLDADPGEQATGSLTVAEPGTYEVICSVPGHAQAGMRATLTVQPAAGS